MPLECNELADILLFADDAKISKNIIDNNDKNKLQVMLLGGQVCGCCY